MNRKRQAFLMMLSGSILIFFTGYMHVWTIYVPRIIEEYHWTESQASLAFYLANGIAVLGSILGGRLSTVWGVRRTAALGGALFSLSYVLSALVIGERPWPIYLSYGLIMALGNGAVYSLILATAQKWFPDRTGFASGVIVTSNGLCMFFMAPLTRLLLSSVGIRGSFLTVAAMIAAASVLACLFLNTPEAAGDKSAESAAGRWGGKKQYTTGEMLRSGAYYLLVGSMLFALLPYYLISPVSQVYQISCGVAEATAVGAVMAGSLLNAGMRLLLPMLADRTNRFLCVASVMLLSMLSMLLLWAHSPATAMVGVALAYACYGGVMGNYPALTSAIFGLEHAGENYGFVMIGLVVGSMAAPVIREGLIALGLSGYKLYFSGAVFAAAGAALVLILRKKAAAMEENRE